MKALMKSENKKFKLIFSLRPGLGREGFKKNGKNQSNHWKDWSSPDYFWKSLVQKDGELEGLPDD